MVDLSPTQRIEELRDSIRHHDHLYYIANTPVISDEEYDRLFQQLSDLEQQHPELITPDSPTQRVGGAPSQRCESVTHDLPMLSISNTYTESELRDFYQRITKEVGSKEPITLTIDPKIDGVAVSVLYESGRFVQGVTRGDGHTGDDITQNVKTIRNLPLFVEQAVQYFPRLELRGEVYMERAAFNALNQTRTEQGESPFANARNATAGSLKLLDSQQVATRPLRIAFHSYGIVETRDLPFAWSTHWQGMDFLASLGLPIVSPRWYFDSFDEVTNHLRQWEHTRHNLPFETDGMVIKVNRFELREQLGATTRSPRWVIAFKYSAQQAQTVLKKIVCQVGRTGIVTPVAELAPVFLAGSCIKRATLHNEDEIHRKDLRDGDKVVIEKGGDVIPKVVRALPHLRDEHSQPFVFPTRCPACQSELIRLPEQVAYRCLNPNCPAQIQARIEHFSSRKAMDLGGLGTSLIKQLLEQRLVSSLPDLYRLTQHKLAALPRMGDKSASNLLKQLEDSKSRPPYRLLFGIGIPLVGEHLAQTLMQSVNNLWELSSVSPEALNAIEGVGPEIAQSVYNWFQHALNQRLLHELEELGLNFQHPKSPTQQHHPAFDGKTFVITGSFSQWQSRTKLSELITKAGGKVTNTVTSNTNFLLCGTNPGTKHQKAQELGIRIIDEDTLKALLDQIQAVQSHDENNLFGESLD